MTYPANGTEVWTLNLTTCSREQLIDISTVIANSFPVSFFHDPNNIPYILMTGDCSGGGKSMIIEAMMKTLLDEHDVDGMKKKDAPRNMFIEKGCGEALDVYCQAAGHTDGSPALYGFDRITSKHGSDAQSNLIKAFQQAAKKSNVPSVGAIFSSDDRVGDTHPWLVIELALGDKDWERLLKIRALNSDLISTPQFRHYWTHLQNFVQTGTLKESALTPRHQLPQARL